MTDGFCIASSNNNHEQTLATNLARYLPPLLAALFFMHWLFMSYLQTTLPFLSIPQPALLLWGSLAAAGLSIYRITSTEK